MSVDKDTVRRVAHLARIEVDDAALEPLSKELSAILSFAEQLAEVDVDGVEPMAHPFDDANRLDEDVPVEGLPTSALLKMSPDSEGDFVKVPKVIDGGGGA